MKKLFISALLALSVAASAFAKDPNNINSALLRSFKADFKNASEVSWVTARDYTKASFTLNNERMEAFYNNKGEVIATSKSITLDELPVSAKRAFTKKFADYTVKEAIRMEGSEESAYYISAENEKETLIVKVDDFGSVSIFKTTKK